MRKGEEIITLEKLFRQCYEVDLTRILVGMELEEKLRYVVEKVQNLTQIPEFGKYLTQLLELDSVILNEDRHMNNIAVIRSNLTGQYRCCPVFDNGAAFFSDTRVDFGLNLSVEECLKKIEAKPFSKSFDEQMDMAESLYGQQLFIGFSEKDIQECLDYVEGYEEAVKQRVLEVLRIQMRKYQYLRKKME